MKNDDRNTKGLNNKLKNVENKNNKKHHTK